MKKQKSFNDQRSAVKNPTNGAYIAEQKKQICQLPRKLAKGLFIE